MGARPSIRRPIIPVSQARITLETGPVRLPAVFFALDGGAWSMGMLRSGLNRGVWGVRNLVDWLLGGSDWGCEDARNAW